MLSHELFIFSYYLQRIVGCQHGHSRGEDGERGGARPEVVPSVELMVALGSTNFIGQNKLWFS